VTGPFDTLRRGHTALLGVAVFLGVMALVAGVFVLARNERAFAMRQWETRLKTVSAQPLVMVYQWLSESRAALHAVAINPTVQINLSEAGAGPDAAATPESTANAIFLASYIASLSNRGPFAPSARTGGDGLAVVDARGNIVAATRGYRPAPSLVAAAIANLKKGNTGPLLSPQSGRAPSVFAASVQPLQAPPSASAIGYVIGERSFDKSFWTSDGSALMAERGHESLVVLRGNDQPLLLGASVAGVAHIAGELDAARAPLHLLRAPDLKGEDSLHLAVPVPQTPWMLVETVPVKTALAGVDQRVRDLLIMLLLVLLAIIAGVFALWRNAVARQQAQAREESIALYRGVVSLLLEAIDLRDPGAAEHSRRAAALAREIAVAMKLPRREVDCVELAGALFNVGKLFVPSDLLTKAGPLDDMERERIDSASRRWLDLLAQVPFELALEPILRSAHDLDGDASRGPTRDSYIVVVANTAIALMSPRSYRPAYSPADTLDLLMTEPVQPLQVSILDALRQIFLRNSVKT
jgi:uncharacterized membrane protein HdeD (DUF308 family)